MKTIKKAIEAPMLVIRYDEGGESPRTWDNLGHFITCERRYDSPDDDEDLKSLIRNLGDESSSAEEHMRKIKEEMKANGYGKVLYITPVYRYEHGNVIYRRGEAHGFDYSNCGFYIVTDKTATKYYGYGETEKINTKNFPSIVDGELETYTKYANGEVYFFILYDNDGEVAESVGGFYDIEDIKEHLPKEWRNENLAHYIEH